MIDVVVEVTGGSAPVLGIALVDSNQRWQASPATSVGWQVTAKPVVTGPDGKPQTKFTDGRNPSPAAGTTYVNVDGITADPIAGKFSTVKVAWKLRAPAQAGSVPLAAVLLYGTEISSPNGAVETPIGHRPGRRLHRQLRTREVQRRPDDRGEVRRGARCRSIRRRSRRRSAAGRAASRS